MFKRYDQGARRAIFGAYTEAQAHGSACIETEHLLLGLVRADPQIVERMAGGDITLESLRTRIMLESMERDPVSTKPDLPLSNECKRVLAYTAEEAERLEDRRIGSRHLLLGLMREHGCRAAELLKQHGADLAAMRNRVAAEPREPRMRRSPTSPSTDERAKEALAGDLRAPEYLLQHDSRPGGLFDRYGEQARRVVFFARFEASHWGRGVIEPEHLLLGILREGLWVVYALLGQENVWNDLIPKLREKLGAAEPKLATSVDLPLSEAAKHVLDAAAEECDRHGGGLIAMAHLILAVLDEPDSYPATLLRQCGADAEAVRRKIAEFRP